MVTSEERFHFASIWDLIAESIAYHEQLARDAIRLPDATGEQAVAASAPEATNVAGGASAEREAAPPAPPNVKLTFGPCRRVSFDPPVSLEVAKAIKAEIDEGIRLANETIRWRRGDD